MAKKAGAFNMAEEIRALLTKNSDLTGRDVYEALQKKFPKVSINRASCSVAFANARKKLGITKKVKKRKPAKKTAARAAGAAKAARKAARKAAKRATKRATKAAGKGTRTAPGALRAAKKLLSECGGDAAVAAEAIRQVAELQI